MAEINLFIWCIKLPATPKPFPEVGIYKKKVLTRKERKNALNLEKSKLPEKKKEKTNLTKNKRKKTRSLPRKKERKQELHQEKKGLRFFKFPPQ